MKSHSKKVMALGWQLANDTNYIRTSLGIRDRNQHPGHDAARPGLAPRRKVHVHEELALNRRQVFSREIYLHPPVICMIIGTDRNMGIGLEQTTLTVRPPGRRFRLESLNYQLTTACRFHQAHIQLSDGKPMPHPPAAWLAGSRDAALARQQPLARDVKRVDQPRAACPHPADPPFERRNDPCVDKSA